MADTSSSSSGDEGSATTAETGTVADTDPLITLISTVNADGITAVYGTGFVLTLACWAIGAKIGIVIRTISKL